jgi:hypothetical protein
MNSLDNIDKNGLDFDQIWHIIKTITISKLYFIFEKSVELEKIWILFDRKVKNILHERLQE